MTVFICVLSKADINDAQHVQLESCWSHKKCTQDRYDATVKDISNSLADRHWTTLMSHRFLATITSSTAH